MTIQGNKAGDPTTYTEYKIPYKIFVLYRSRQLMITSSLDPVFILHAFLTDFFLVKILLGKIHTSYAILINMLFPYMQM